MKPIARAALFVFAILLVPAVFAADAWLAHAGASGAAARTLVRALGLAAGPARVATALAPLPGLDPLSAPCAVPAPAAAAAPDAPCCDDVEDAVVAVPSPASAVANIMLATTSGSMVARVTPSGYFYSTTDDAPSGFSWALVQPGDRGISSMSEGGDWKRLKRLHSSVRVATAWFRLDGREWTSTDAALIAELRRAIAPVEALGRRQGELGGRQGELGGEQGRLGAKLGELGGRLGALAVRSASRRDDAAVDRERDAIEREMESLQRQMEPLARRQEVLGRQQSVLGAEQQRVSARAKREVRALFERAVRERRVESSDVDA